MWSRGVRLLTKSCVCITRRRQYTKSQPASQLVKSPVTASSSSLQALEQPLKLYPASAVNRYYYLDPEPQATEKIVSVRSRRAKCRTMSGFQNVHIPGLTLLKQVTVASHPAAATPTRGGQNVRLTTTPNSKPKNGCKRKQIYHKDKAAVSQAAASRWAYQTQSPNPDLTSIQEARQPPSQASGGVPEPSPLYLAQSFAPPVSLPEPRRILVIMDLNGTLLYRPSKRRPFDFVERPYARRFLSYCLDTFYVAIWSSARPDNVHKMLDQLLTPEQRSKCVVTWARDKFDLSPADYDSRIQCYKRLTRLWADPNVIMSHPTAAFGGRWDQTNTVLVDDSLEKGRSEPHSILQIPEFSGLPNEPADVLPQVHNYLNSLCYQLDISRFMRETPFQLNGQYELPLKHNRA